MSYVNKVSLTTSITGVKISEMPTTDKASTDDKVIIETVEGTKAITVKNLIPENNTTPDTVVVTEKTGKKYGVRWYKENPNSDLERLGDAGGLTAMVYDCNDAKNGYMRYKNSFDSVYPWSDRKVCNLSDTGEVLAYEGDNNFKRDGSNGNVMVETPLFYIKHVESKDFHEFWIADYPAPGFVKPQRFVTTSGKTLDKIYTGAYEASLDGDKLRSRTGTYPATNMTRSEFRDKARLYGKEWGIIDFSYRYEVLFYLFVIEYATLSSSYCFKQDYLLFGISGVDETFKLKYDVKNYDTLYLDLGYYLPEKLKININGVEYETDGYISGNERLDLTENVTATTNDTITIVTPAICGGSDEVPKPTGAYSLGYSTKRHFKYRGEENPWGNTHEWIDGCVIYDGSQCLSYKHEQYDDETWTGVYKPSIKQNSGFLKSIGDESDIEKFHTSIFPSYENSNVTVEPKTYFRAWFGAPSMYGTYIPKVGGSIITPMDRVGLMTVYFNNTVDSKDNFTGSRLSYMPL